MASDAIPAARPALARFKPALRGLAGAESQHPGAA